MQKINILILIQLLILLGCQYNDLGKNTVNHCDGGSSHVPFDLLTQTGSVGCSLQNVSDPNVNSVGESTLIVIQTQNDYEKYVFCNSGNPQIDFNQKTLLAGMYVAANGDLVSAESVDVDCNNNYSFNIQMRYGTASAITKVYFYAIISKTSPQAKITVSVTY